MLRSVAGRFHLVATDSKYKAVTKVLGFQATHARLKECLVILK